VPQPKKHVAGVGKIWISVTLPEIKQRKMDCSDGAETVEKFTRKKQRSTGKIID